MTWDLLLNKWVGLGVLLLGLLAGAYHLGWKSRDADFSKYKAEQSEIVAEQALKVTALERQNDEITKQAAEKYAAGIAGVRDYYERLYHSRSGPVSQVPKPPSRVDEVPTDSLPLAGQCAETTEQLIELQEWIKKVTPD